MAKSKKNSSRNSSRNVKSKKNRFIIVVTALVLIGFLAFILADLFKPSKISNEPATSVSPADNLKFVKNGEVSFLNSDSELKSKIDVQFAENDNQRTQGLMYRTELKEDEGMLFIFPVQDYQSFWMRNTILSLDMIFVDSNLQIVTIHKNTKPYSTQSYPSSKPAQYVIEVNSGYCDRHNVNENDKIVFRRTN